MLTSPLFVVVLSATFLREELSLQKIIAILIGFVGGIILIGPSSLIESNVTLSGLNTLLKGTLFIIAAAISLALSVVLTRPLARELDSKSITFWSMCMGEIFFLIFSLFENKPVGSGPVTTQAIMALIYLSLVCSVLAFILWNQAIIKSSPQEIASTMHVKTPVAIIIGHLLAGEALTVTIIAGCLCISFAIWFSQTTFKRWSAT
jgi:drug/metabolite transporter (DMT)-like permease